MEVVGRDGVEGLTATAVSRAAGVSHGTFYNHVEGTDALAELVVAELVRVFELAASAASDEECPAATVAGGVARVLALPQEDPVYARALVVAIAVRADLRGRIRDIARRAVLAGTESGDFAVPSVEVATEALLGAVVQLLRAAVHDRVELPTVAAVEVCLALLGVPPERRDRLCRDVGGVGRR